MWSCLLDTWPELMQNSVSSKTKMKKHRDCLLLKDSNETEPNRWTLIGSCFEEKKNSYKRHVGEGKLNINGTGDVIIELL